MTVTINMEHEYEFYNEIARQIKALRIKSNLTQEQFDFVNYEVESN